MINWWNSLELISQIFACIAIPATLVLLIQTIMMFIGLDTDSDASDGLSLDDSFDGDGLDAELGDGLDDISDVSEFADLKIFTLRGLIAFFVVFGWVGFVMNNSGAALWLTIIVSSICGFAMMTALAFMMRYVMKLRSDGNIDNKNAIGVSGRVYLTIPAERHGEGKVNVLIQGSYVEREAVTDEKEPIKTGSEIVVIGLSGQTTLVVKSK